MNIVSVIKDLGLAVFSLIGLKTLIEDYFKHNLDKKEKNRIRRNQGKEQLYTDLLSNGLAFFTGWENKEHQKQFARELYTKGYIFASDEVFNLANEFLKNYSNEELKKKNDKVYFNLVIQIRGELCEIWEISKTNLKPIDLEMYKFESG